MVSVKYKMCGTSDNILVLGPQKIIVIVSIGMFAHVTPFCHNPLPLLHSRFTSLKLVIFKLFNFYILTTLNWRNKFHL